MKNILVILSVFLMFGCISTYPYRTSTLYTCSSTVKIADSTVQYMFTPYMFNKSKKEMKRFVIESSYREWQVGDTLIIKNK